MKHKEATTVGIILFAILLSSCPGISNNPPPDFNDGITIFMPDSDLDDDGIINLDDTDIDGDGLDNTSEESFGTSPYIADTMVMAFQITMK